MDLLLAHFMTTLSAQLGRPSKRFAPDALALERSAQVEKPGWAARFRAAKLAKKAKK